MIEDAHLREHINGFQDIRKKWSGCILVTGAGGCRSDFVVGWLLIMMKSCQYTMPWSINPFNGQSINNLSTQLYNRFLLWDEPMPQTPACIDWLLDHYSSDADRWLVQKTHKPMDIIDERLPKELKDKILILDIISNDDLDTATNATWEFMIKTFVPKNPRNVLMWYDYEKAINFDDDSEYYQAVSTITDEFIEKRSWVRKHLKDIDMPSRQILYQDLLGSQGKHRLSDILDFDLNEHGNHVWDSGIFLAKTADKIQAIGQSWSKDEIKSKILSYHPDLLIQDPSS